MSERLCESCHEPMVIKSGGQRWCRLCVPNPAAWQRMVRYGVSDPQLKLMFERQAGKCGLCKRDMKLGGRSLHCAVVDHDHQTGVVRGLLCFKCNSVLGYAEANAGWLEEALSWVKGLHSR